MALTAKPPYRRLYAHDHPDDTISGHSDLWSSRRFAPVLISGSPRLGDVESPYTEISAAIARANSLLGLALRNR